MSGIHAVTTKLERGLFGPMEPWGMSWRAMLAAFLAGNLVNVYRAAGARAQAGAADVRSILRAHCVPVF